MAVNYIQYLSSITQNQQIALRFLVSGIDVHVRRAVGLNIVNTCRAQNKTLFIVGDTNSSYADFGNMGGYKVKNILSGEISLCNDLLDVSSLLQISRLRSLLTDIGFDSIQAMKVVNYLSFVKETERRLGNCNTLTVDTLEEYGATVMVEWKLNQLVKNGNLTNADYDYLISRYSEVSANAADFEAFLVVLAPFLTGDYPTADTAVYLPLGEFVSDPMMQKIMCKLLLAYMRQAPDSSAVIILDDGKSGDRGCLLDLVKGLPATADVHFLTSDAFSLSDSDINILLNTFPVRIYSRHSDMNSCAKIEHHCGQIDVVKRSSSITVDRRMRSNSAWDMLLGTNRSETEIRNAPVKEYRFRKELIQSLPPATAIIDCCGSQTMFQF